MENKKLGIIIASVAVILFVIVAFIFMYEPARNIFTKTQVVEQEEITGDLPVLECNYNSDKESYNDATTKKNVNLCDCINSDKLQNTCKTVTMNIIFYNNALKQLDESLCNKISSDIQKQSCQKVVKSSISELKQNNPEYLARVYAATHDERAIGELEDVINEDLDNISAYVALALAYAEQGLKEQEQGNDQTPYVNKAFDAIENAKAIDKNNSEVYRAEGYINEIKPDYEKAITLYDKAIKIDKNNSMAYAGRGHLYRMMGILEQSVKDFQVAAELDTKNENIIIYTNLCNLEYSRSYDEEAIKNCKIVTQKEVTDPVFQSEAYQIMSEIFIKNNDLKQARNYLLKAKTLTPNNSNLYVFSSKLNFFEQTYEQAEADAKRAIELSPTKASAFLALANALYMQEKYNDAIKQAQDGIILIVDDVSLLDPSKPAVNRDLNYVIAFSYNQLGDEVKFKEYKEKALGAFEQSNYLNIKE